MLPSVSTKHLQLVIFAVDSADTSLLECCCQRSLLKSRKFSNIPIFLITQTRWNTIPVIVPVARLMWLYLSYTAISTCLKTCHVAGMKIEWYVHFTAVLYDRILWHIIVISCTILKGTVPPKIFNYVIIYSSSVVQNLYDVISSVEHNIRCFEECW